MLNIITKYDRVFENVWEGASGASNSNNSNNAAKEKNLNNTFTYLIKYWLKIWVYLHHSRIYFNNARSNE